MQNFEMCVGIALEQAGVVPDFTTMTPELRERIVEITRTMLCGELNIRCEAGDDNALRIVLQFADTPLHRHLIYELHRRFGTVM